MADLLSGSERVLEVTGGTSVTKDVTFVIEKAHEPAGKIFCSGRIHHHSLDGTPESGNNVDASEIDLDTSVSNSSGVKKGKGYEGNLQVVSQCSEPEEASTHEHSLSFPPTLKLVSAMKGSRERNGESSPTENRRVKWAADVYDPPVTSVSHSVKSRQQRPRSRKKDKNKHKQKQKWRSRRSRKGKKTCPEDDVRHVPALQDAGTGSSLVELGEVESGILDYEMGGQESKCRTSFLHENAAQTHFSAAETS